MAFKEEANGCGLVVLNPQGNVLNTDAFHLIQVQGMKAFPLFGGNDSAWTKKFSKGERGFCSVECRYK
ncbi:hypothetical protein QN277_010531 [Acacia crassicarpa]|uniref:Uncharacterized protein n=1 Tax=Acacia crassicarpa TaxID=499986 RepID=A0AAE1M5M9_9FABA|nr:hypothetical protein QN277_010531 [Acacia crassicarpa]